MLKTHTAKAYVTLLFHFRSRNSQKYQSIIEAGVNLIFYTCDPSTLHKPLISLDRVGMIRTKVVPRAQSFSIDFQSDTEIVCRPDLIAFAIFGGSAGALATFGA